MINQNKSTWRRGKLLRIWITKMCHTENRGHGNQILVRSSTSTLEFLMIKQKMDEIKDKIKKV